MTMRSLFLEKILCFGGVSKLAQVDVDNFAHIVSSCISVCIRLYFTINFTSRKCYLSALSAFLGSNSLF